MRKGSLQLSVGAIITLIIAVAVLGLVIGFAATQFGAISQKIVIEEETPEPSASSPVTLPGGRSQLTLEKNTGYEMNVKIYNSETVDYNIGSTENFMLNCDSTAVTETTVTFEVPPVKVESGKVAEVPVLLDVAGTVPVGKYACTLGVNKSTKSIFLTIQ